MGSGAMLKPTGHPNLPRPQIRPGYWGQWLAPGAAGLVGFVILALLLMFTKPLVRRLLVIIGCLLALLIGWSRSYLGDHWPTDVLVGWLLASATVAVTMALVNLTLVLYPESQMSNEIDPDHPAADQQSRE